MCVVALCTCTDGWCLSVKALTQLQNIRQRILLSACEASTHAWERNMRLSVAAQIVRDLKAKTSIVESTRLHIDRAHMAQVDKSRIILIGAMIEALGRFERMAVCNWVVRCKAATSVKLMTQQQVNGITRLNRMMNGLVLVEKQNRIIAVLCKWRQQSGAGHMKSRGLVGRSGWSILRLCVAGSAPRKHVHNWR